MYRERPSSIPHAVVWASGASTQGEDHRVLPDGCMDLIWHRGELLVAGPDTVAHISRWAPGAGYVGLRLGAGAGPRVLGLPARELRDQRVPLADVWAPRQARRLTQQLAASSHPERTLEAAAAHRLRQAAPPDPVAAALMRRLARGASVVSLAADLGLSTRQLHRRSLDALGYGPKTFARILRLNRALELRRAGQPAAEAAMVAGYADQAHLAREVRALSGVTLTTLLT